MKIAVFITLASLGLTSYTTVLYSPATGKPLARFGGDMQRTRYSGGGVTWDCDRVDHSTTTRAAGSVVGTAAAGAMGIIMAGAVR